MCYAELKNELEQMSEVEPEIYDSLYEVVEVSHLSAR